MISNYKNISRAVAALSAVVVVALGCFLLTAAEKKAPEAKSEPPQEAKPEPGGRVPVQAGIEALERELERLDELTRKKEREVDLLKERLGISEIEESAHGKPDPEMLRRMEALHIDAMAQYQQVSTLYSTLTNLSRPELLAAVATASPDAQLAELQSRLALAEQNYAEGFEKYGADHPENKKTRRMMEKIQQQMNDRLNGVMQGLKVRTEAQKSSAERLRHELQKAKEYNIDRTIRQRPYFQAKRELENLRQVRDAIWKRLIMEQIDAKLPPGLRGESGRSL